MSGLQTSICMAKKMAEKLGYSYLLFRALPTRQRKAMTHTSHHRMVQMLTYAGTLPLIIVAAQPIIGGVHLNDALWVSTTYSATILSFLAGIHWACYLFFSDRCPRNLLIISNAVALLAWISLLSPQQPWSVLLQILCFLYLFVLDSKLQQVNILPPWFYTLRRNATVIVVLSLCIIMSQS